MTDRRAPVQGDAPRRRTSRPAGTVPWDVHERAWTQYAALGHGDQSAERIAMRGGFGYDEMACLLAKHDPYRATYKHRHPAVPYWVPI